MRKLRLCGLLSCLLVSTSYGQTTEPVSTGAATIYFYRLREAYGALLKPSVYSDKVQLGRMRNGRFLSVTMPVGSHTITSNFEGNGLVLDVKPGGVYYIRLELSRPGLIHNARGQVSLVSPEQGAFEVKQLEVAEPDDLKGAGK